AVHRRRHGDRDGSGGFVTLDRDLPLWMRSTARAAIIAHAGREAPRECCGLLIGREGLVENAWPAANLREGEVAFLVSPEDHFAAIRHARATGRLVIGAYHSHPRSPAVPSATDLEEANDPEL